MNALIDLFYKKKVNQLMSRKPTILICDDDRDFHFAFKAIFRGKYEFRSTYNTEEAFAVVKNQQIDLLILDIQIRTPDEGLCAIPKFKEIDPDLDIIVSSGLTDYKTVLSAMKLGAINYLVKGANPDEITITIAQTLERRSLVQKTQQQNFEAVNTQKQHLLLGESAAIQILKKTIDRIRQSPANVVITGETGTGKEVVARQLRKAFPDGTLAPFVAIDSSTIQASTAESILFGHEKGAFTGAERTTQGLFEEANNGIIYFDEIGNMPLEIQAKLLRVIQEREISRMGSSRILSLNFRVVCATNKNLEEMVTKGEFKDDLLQRLNVLPIQLPPLRDRKEDIPILIRHFLTRLGPPANQLNFTNGAIEILQAYSWPGNIRELSNVIAYVTTMADGPDVDAADLPPKFRDAKIKADHSINSTKPSSECLSFYDQVTQFEKELLRKEYQKHEGNISKLAFSLGMDRSHLYTKLKEAGLHTVKKK